MFMNGCYNVYESRKNLAKKCALFSCGDYKTINRKCRGGKCAFCVFYVLTSHFVTVNSQYLKSRYLELCPISNKTFGPFSINSSGGTTRYLELSNFFSGPLLSVRDIES